MHFVQCKKIITETHTLIKQQSNKYQLVTIHCIPPRLQLLSVVLGSDSGLTVQVLQC